MKSNLELRPQLNPLEVQEEVQVLNGDCMNAFRTGNGVLRTVCYNLYHSWLLDLHNLGNENNGSPWQCPTEDTFICD